MAATLSCGTWTHDYPISVSEARELGLKISVDLPTEVYELMALYREPTQRRPSVQYVPLPYRSRPEERPRSGRHGGGPVPLAAASWADRSRRASGTTRTAVGQGRRAGGSGDVPERRGFPPEARALYGRSMDAVARRAWQARETGSRAERVAATIAHALTAERPTAA